MTSIDTSSQLQPLNRCHDIFSICTLPGAQDCPLASMSQSSIDLSPVPTHVQSGIKIDEHMRLVLARAVPSVVYPLDASHLVPPASLLLGLLRYVESK